MANELNDDIVLLYLKKRGYVKTEEILLQEIKSQGLADYATDSMLDIRTDLLPFIRLYDPRESMASCYERSYIQLRKFIDESLDMYRNELVAVLYPLYIHSFLDLVEKGFPKDALDFLKRHYHQHAALHAAEISSLEAVSSPAHFLNHDTVRLYRNYKVDVEMSSFSQQFLFSFLLEHNMKLMAKIVNERINIKVTSERPLVITEPESNLSTQRDQELSVNKYDIRWVVDHGSSKVPLPSIKDEQLAAAAEEARLRIRLSKERLPSVCMFTLLNSLTIVNSVSLSQDGSAVAAACSDSLIRVWHMNPSQSQRGDSVLAEHELSLGLDEDEDDEDEDDEEEDKEEDMDVDSGSRRKKRRVDISSDQKRSEKRQQEEQNAARKRNRAQRLPTKYVGHTGPVFRASFSPDNQFLLSASEDCSVRLWSLETDLNLVCYRGHNYPVWDVQFSPLGFYFATASSDRTARLWSTDKIYPLRIFCGHHADVDCVRFHPNCNYLATASSDTTMRLWDIQTGQCVRLFKGHNCALTSLAISPLGKLAATGSEDGRVLVWDLSAGKKLAVLSGHRSAVTSLDWSREGTLLASGSALPEGSVRLWDATFGQQPIGHQPSVFLPSESQIRASSPAPSPSPSTSSSTSSSSTNASKKKGNTDPHCVGHFPTKNTPVTFLKFTPRNLLLSAGVYVDMT